MKTAAWGAAWLRGLAPGVCWLLALGCTQRTRPEEAAAVDLNLDEGAVARVGSATIPAAAVAAVSAAQGVAPKAALERLLRDTLLAEHARGHPAWQARVAGAESAVLARVLLERFRAENDARPVTDAEIHEAVSERWREYDRPVSVRTIHAVVQFRAEADEPRARVVAEAIRAAVSGATDEAEFERAARAVAADGFTVKVESLDPITAEGDVVTPHGGALVEQYARAAHAIKDVGGTSAVTRTAYGYHVIRLVERLPPQVVPFEEARRRLEPVVRGVRAKTAHSALLRELAQREPSVVDRAAVDVTGAIHLEP